MTLRHVLQAIGFDSEDLQRVWGDDPAARIEERRARLHRVLKQRYAALVRRRCIIESLKDRIARAEKRAVLLATQAADEIFPRIERDPRLLQRHERMYQTPLGETVRLLQKLAHLRCRMSASAYDGFP